MPHKRLESIPNASIRFQTDNKRFQRAIFLGQWVLFCNFALRGGPVRPHKKLSTWKPNYKRLHRFFTKWLDLNEIWPMLNFEKHHEVQIFALANTHLIQR